MFQTKILLTLIIAVGLFLRFYQIGVVPPSLNWDEVSHGYNAYSILQTGKDEWGVSYPNIFRAFGDYKLPVYIYSTSLSEALFGLNIFAVRLPSLLAGLALIIFTFLLTRKIFNTTIALISAFLVAVEPWTFFLSRGAFEANLSAPLVAGGIYFYLEGLKRPKWIILSAILFGLSVWTYNSARIFIPLLLAGMCILYFKDLSVLWKKQKSTLVLGIIAAALFLLPMAYQLLKPEGQARYSNLAILNEGAIAYVEQEQNRNPQITPVLNRYTYFGFEFAKNWISHYSPNFLFFTGGTHYQFSVPNRGLLYLVNLPFFLFGFVLLLKNYKKYKLLGLWFLLAPVAGSLTRDVPHVLRSVVMLPLPMIITAYGLYNFFVYIKKYRVLFFGGFAIYLLLLSFLSFQYLKNYFYTYPKEYSQAWQYGHKEAVDYIKANYEKYDQIIMTKKYGEPHEFILFYWPWDPEKYRNDPNLVRYPQSNWFWVDSFDKFYFVNDWEIPKDENKRWKTERNVEIDVSKKTLLVTSPDTYPPGWKKLETIYFLDRKPAFEILENEEN